MKKLLIALLCVSLTCAVFLTSCKKEEVEEKQAEEKIEQQIPEVDPIPFEYNLEKSKGTAVITSYTGEETHVTVPSVINAVVEVPLTKEEIAALEAEIPENEKTAKKSRKTTKAPTKHVIQEFNVTGIEDGAFFANETVESVTIEEGIGYIGDAVFQNCKALTSIKLPESLTEIGTRAFYGCEVLSELNIGANVSSIGYMAFSDIFFEIPWYANLTDTAVIVGDGVLLKYNSTADVVFGNEVKHVAYYAFANNPISNITFADSLKTVDSKAFFESNPTVHVSENNEATQFLSIASVNVVKDVPSATFGEQE